MRPEEAPDLNLARMRVADGFVRGISILPAGLVIDYGEDFDDDEDWFSTHQEALAQGGHQRRSRHPSHSWPPKLEGPGLAEQIPSESLAEQEPAPRPARVNVDPGRKFNNAVAYVGMVGLIPPGGDQPRHHRVADM